MRLEFRLLPAGQAPGAGEVWVVEASRQPAVGGLASAVQARGLAALACGPGEAHTLVVDCGFLGPTLDAMVAASFARLASSGQDISGEGYRSLALYAAHLLTGHRPEGTPPDRSVAGVYQAVRNAAGEADLRTHEAGERFRRAWAKMEACLLKAAAAGSNPFQTSPVAADPEFAEERAFLAADRVRYREDVARGARWTVLLPGARSRVGGLLLLRPTSLLFKYWAREDPEGHEGAGYPFLAVHWGDGRWVFSTDPARPTPIAGLAAALQTREERSGPARANADPWYDGARHEHTLVSAPKAGSALSEAEVLRVARSWAGVRPAAGQAPPAGWQRTLLTAAGLILACVLAYVSLRPPPRAAPDNGLLSVDGKRVPVFFQPYAGGRWQIRNERKRGEGLEVPAGETRNLRIDAPGGLPGAGPLRLLLHTKTGGRPSVTMRVEDGTPEEGVRLAWASRPGPAAYVSARPLSWAGSDTLVIGVHNPGKEGISADYEVELLPATLRVLAAGASDCQALGQPLDSALRDAERAAEEAARQQGRLFGKVEATRLVGKACTRDAIYGGFQELKKAAPGDLCVVILSGHGVVDANGTYLFAPSDFRPEAKGMRGIPGQEIVRELCEVGCPVLVLLDTCHSGAATLRVSLPDGHPGMRIFASTLASAKARGGERWAGHGPLILAFIEALRNERLVAPGAGGPALAAPGPSGLLSWQDLRNYLEPRLDELTNGRQTMQEASVPGRNYAELPLASLLVPAGKVSP